MNTDTTKHRLGIAVAVLVAATLVGCGAEAQNPQPSGGEFTVLHAGDVIGSGNFTNKQSAVLTDQETYEDTLARYTSEPPAQVSFGSSRVLLVDMGERPSGGYSIQVSTIETQNNRTIAEVTLTQPGENCVVTEAITNPYQFVEVPVTHEVLVREELYIDQCN